MPEPRQYRTATDDVQEVITLILDAVATRFDSSTDVGVGGFIGALECILADDETPASVVVQQAISAHAVAADPLSDEQVKAIIAEYDRIVRINGSMAAVADEDNTGEIGWEVLDIARDLGIDNAGESPALVDATTAYVLRLRAELTADGPEAQKNGAPE